jgi:hypothetical protein
LYRLTKSGANVTESSVIAIDARMVNMHDTLSSLVERALAGNQRPLEFYLRENSRLPGARANLELANDLGYLLANAIPKCTDNVHALLEYFISDKHRVIIGNTPEEFVLLCSIICYGTCAAVQPAWRMETFALLESFACSPYWRIRESVATAYQRLLVADATATISQLTCLATEGNYLQQRAAIASVAEPPLLYNTDILDAALRLQTIVLERVRLVPITERRNEDFRVLRRTLGYTLSVVTAASPEQGFALMRECATWHDHDVHWVLRENLRKKRLARFAFDTANLLKLLT